MHINFELLITLIFNKSKSEIIIQKQPKQIVLS